MSDDLVKRICKTWIEDGRSDNCFWEGWPENPTPDDSLTPGMVLGRIEELEAKLAKAVGALERIAHASDIYSVEANAEDQGADTLAYAHKSTCNLARTTLAELKGDKP